MSIGVFAIVLLAAFLHAGWNTILKKEDDKLVGALGVAVGGVPLAVGSLLVVGLPPIEALPLAVVSGILHTGYFVFLLNAYRLGDMTQVYPVARGVAPLLTAMFAALTLGETIGPMESIGILIIALGVSSVVLTAKGDGRLSVQSLGLALMTSVFISAYSLNDGAGARIAGNSLAFFSVALLFNSVLMIALVLAKRGKATGAALRKARMSMLIGGPGSFVAYALVTFAFTQAPIALVAALRETSVIIALVLGTIALKERLNWRKVVSTFVTLSGIVVLRMQK